MTPEAKPKNRQYGAVRILVIAQLADIRQWLDAGKTLSGYHREHGLTVSCNRFSRVARRYLQLERANQAHILDLSGDSLAQVGAPIVSPALKHRMSDEQLARLDQIILLATQRD